MALKFENTCQDLPSKYKSVLDAADLAHEVPYNFEILLESHPLPEGIYTIIDHESHSIGIPKRVLKDAARTAWQDFFHVDAALEGQYIASSVILLIHPEHITAANARKRFVAHAHERDMRVRRIKRDLCFLESLFISPLHRHTKSPTLWAHHGWLIKQLDVSVQMQAIDLNHLQPYLRAGEIHPKNVYAWQYLRYRISDTPGLYESFSYSSDESISRSQVGGSVFGMPAILSYFLAWCLRHLSDTSGWSFLLWLLRTNPGDDAEMKKWQVVVFEEVLRTAIQFGYRSEGLWEFLRTLASSSTFPAPMQADFQRGAAQLFAAGRDIDKWLSILSK